MRDAGESGTDLVPILRPCTISPFEPGMKPSEAQSTAGTGGVPMTNPKTAADRRQERERAEDQYWQKFKARLESAGGYAEIRAIAEEAPPPDAVGRQFHSNLIFFLDTFSRPGGASAFERALYVQLLRGMDAAGDLKPGVRRRAERDLGSAFN
jgi:hypothetical protein